MVLHAQIKTSIFMYKLRSIHISSLPSVHCPNCCRTCFAHNQCLAMAALRRMAIPQDNRHLLVEAGILTMLARAGRSGEVEIQREVKLACADATTRSTCHW